MKAPAKFRSWVRDLPIERKLQLCMVSTCLVVLVLACAVLFWFQSLNFRRGIVAELESLGAITARNTAAPLTFNDQRSAVEVLKALTQKSHIVAANIHDASGRLFASVGGRENFFVPLDGVGVVFDQGYATLSLPIRIDETAAGRLTIHARIADKYRQLLVLYLGVLAAVLIGSLAVILVMTSFLQRMIARPIVELARVAQRVSENEDYAARAHEQGQDEVGRLTHTFNRMLEQIQLRDRKLTESHHRYEVAVAGSNDGLWDWDPINRTLYLSPRWKSMLGYASYELSNDRRTFRALLHPDDVARVDTSTEDCLAGRTNTYGVEYRMRHKDGDYRWILSRGATLRDSQGVVIRFAGSHTDITDRKKTDEEIRFSREKFESLVNSVNGIVWEADALTSQCLFINDQVVRILGYPVRRWLEEPGFAAKIVHPDDRAATFRAGRRGIVSGQPFQIEHRVLAADGRIVWLRESVAVQKRADGGVRQRGLAIDITAQKLAAEQIVRMQRELVDASRIAGMAEVATGVLHNVGNVLNSVNLSAGLLVEQLRRSKTANLARAVQLLSAHEHDLADFLLRDPKGRQLPTYFAALSAELQREQTGLTKEAEDLQRNVEHIKQIVAMQQSFAKVSGALERLALHEVVEDALRMTSGAMARHQVEIVREFQAVPPLMLDRHKVLQILVNLLNNARQALDARPDGRRITIRLGLTEGGVVRVAVCDNGLGIPRENLNRIFNHGFTTKKTGHGFGLHSGANAAKEMGGSLTVTSEGPGLGATFCLELPAVAAAREPGLKAA